MKTRIKSAVIFFLHLSFIFMLIFFAAALLHQKQTRMTLSKGQELPLPAIRKDFGIPAFFNPILRLGNFIVYDSKDKQYFESDFVLIDQKKTNHLKLAVNQPLDIDGIKLYQKSWVLEFHQLVVSFLGRKYNMLADHNALCDTNGNEFQFTAYSVVSNQITYQWALFDRSGKIIQKGDLSKRNIPILPFIEQNKVSIIQEEYDLKSVIQASYEPYHLFLLITAVLFLLILGYHFFAGMEGEK
jgi:ResB-like family